MSLNSDIFKIWNKNFDRKDTNGKFKPIFTRYIGIEDKFSYNNILKTLIAKCEENSKNSIVFKNSIPFNVDFNLMTYVNNELNHMNILNLKNEDICVFDSSVINSMFLDSLNYVIDIATKKENFFNDSVRNNFIATLILWTVTFVKNIEFSDFIVPKCVYYGNISRKEIYFLLLLYRMSFDVLFINPLKDETSYWNDIDIDKLSNISSFQYIEQVNAIEERIKNASIINEVHSTTKLHEEQIKNSFFTGTGIYKPWQFKGWKTCPIFINSSLIDVTVNWNEPAKVREGFQILGNTVQIPTFFSVIEGTYEDSVKYSELVKKCSLSEDTLVIKDCGQSLMPPQLSENDSYKLMFAQLSDGSFSDSEIKKFAFYPLGNYNIDTQNLILSKINETISDKTLFNISFTKEETLQFVLFLLNIDKKVIKLINGFDFAEKIPKITVFLNREETLERTVVLLLGFLSKIGFDIIVFNPSGLFSLDSVINSSRFTTTRLDKIDYVCDYDNIINKKTKKSFFGRLFN